MGNMEDLKKIFKSNILKVSKKLGKNIEDITRAEYRKTTRDLRLPREEGKNIGGFKNMLFEICKLDDISKYNNYTDYKGIFKNSLLEVGEILNKKISAVTRDEYIKTSKDKNIAVLTKHRLGELGGFVVLKNDIFKSEIENETKKDYVLREFLDFVAENGYIPTFSDFKSICKDVKNTFEDIEHLEQEVRYTYPELDDYIFNESSFTPDYRYDLEKEMRKYKRFIVTTAVSGKNVQQDFLNSLTHYAKEKNAMVLILPCEDVSSRKEAHKWSMDPLLKKFRVVVKDLYLNDNVCLCTIKVSAKQINPLTGLDRLTQRKNASIIVAAPKVFLKYVPSTPDTIPNALMTTGAITEANYDNDAYMSHRTSTIAENDHMIGAVMVEIQDKEIFHFRHLQSSSTGSISDLGYEYFPNGEVKKCSDTVLVFGDSHVGMHDEKLVKSVTKIIPLMNCDTVVLHDVMNASSISHHDIGRIAIKSIKANKGESSLEKEGFLVKDYLDTLSDKVGNVVIVKSNHDIHLDRYLTEGRFMTDPVNFYFSLDLVKKLIEGGDPLKYMMEEKIKLKNKNITWLRLDESYKKYGVELGYHGDIGANGGRGSAKTFENSIGNIITAHSHGASISRTVFVVGTTSVLRMDYNKGLSSWTRTCALVYKNGTRQLINFIPYKGNYEYTIKGN